MPALRSRAHRGEGPREVALHGWEDEDVYLFLDDLGPDDFLRSEAPRYGAFDAVWVFTPEIVEPEGRL